MKTYFPGSKNQLDHWSSDDILCRCPQCGANAVVKLTERLLKLQPDDTTHVCHPGFGGCNQGFAMDAEDAE